MKRTMFIILMLLIPLTASSADNDKKMKAFQKSVEQETAGNYTEAVTAIMAIYRGNSEDYLINLRLGWLHYLLTDYDESIDYYSKAVSISNHSIESMIGITYPYSAKENWDKVKEIYNRILDKDPMNYTANLRSAQSYFYAQDYLNARRIFEKMFKEYPSDFELNLFLGWTHYYLGDMSTAESYFTTALIIVPNNKSALEGMALVK